MKKHKHRCSRLLCLTLAVCLLTGCSGKVLQQMGSSSSPGQDSTAISETGAVSEQLSLLSQKCEAGDIDVYLSPDGSTQAILGRFTDSQVTSSQQAEALLQEYAGVLGLSAMGTVNEKESTTEGTVYQMDQQVNGIAVQGGETILSADSQGNVTGVYNYCPPDLLQTDTQPDASLDEESEILARAYGLIGEQLGRDVKNEEKELYSIQYEPVVYAGETDSCLVWKVQISLQDPGGRVEDLSDEELQALSETDETADFVPAIWYLYANGANTGNVMMAEPLESCALFSGSSTTVQATGNSGQTVKIDVQKENGKTCLYDTGRNIEIFHGKGIWNNVTDWLNETFCLEDTGWEKNWIWPVSNTRGVTALYNISLTYDWYLENCGRQGMDGKNGKLNVAINQNQLRADSSTMRYVAYLLFSSSRNASFTVSRTTGEYMIRIYGRDLENALDTMAHEYTHGVIAFIVGKPGDVSDSLINAEQSGALNESYADIFGAIIENKNDDGFYQKSEDSGDLFYDIRHLSTYNLPQSMADYDREADIHFNGVIFTRAWYLMLEDERLRTVSRDNWGVIYYNSLHYLGTTATFRQARAAVAGSCLEAGFTAEQMSAVYDAFDTVGITGNRLSSTLPGDKDGTSTYEYLSFDASLYNIFHASLQEVESFDWDSYYTTEGGDVGSENGTSLYVQGWYSDISVSITFSPVTKDHARCFPVMACIIDPVGDPGLEVYGGIRFGMDLQEVSSLIQMDEVMLNGIGGFDTARRVFTAYPNEKCCLEMIFEQKEGTGDYVLTQATMTSTSY